MIVGAVCLAAGLGLAIAVAGDDRPDGITRTGGDGATGATDVTDPPGPTTSATVTTTPAVPYLPPTPTPTTTPTGADGCPPDLPTVVADKHRAIVAAAEAGDYELLAELAGAPFEATFGGPVDDLVAYWADLDLAPTIAATFELSHSVLAADTVCLYQWPGAFSAAYPTWDDVPAELIDELRSLYTDDELDGFADFGGFIGYRGGITADGDWVFFLAGD